jgi:hypothetical protein
MNHTHRKAPAPNPASPTYTVPPVIRSYALSVDAFDHLKAMQRSYERLHGIRLTNSEALEFLLTEHQAWMDDRPRRA